jgi:hypothetical protein
MSAQNNHIKVIFYGFPPLWLSGRWLEKGPNSGVLSHPGEPIWPRVIPELALIFALKYE